ncbi:E3 ubiquitin-protein ligase arkadia-A [Dirofilaria immitis]
MMTTFIPFLIFVSVVFSQKIQSKRTQELLEPITYNRGNREVIAKAEEQLMNTLSLLQILADDSNQLEMEKRRNKFEFIRFGRR